MPEQARLLQFPGRPSKPRSRSDAIAAAQTYLSLGADERSRVDVESAYGDLDVLLGVCGLLRERCNTDPADTLAEASRIHGWVTRQGKDLGYFDERDFFLGESALLAASASRHVGDRAETELWLDRADSSYRHTINPSASLARVAYVRLALRYDMGRYTDVLELLPSVDLTFEKVGMFAEVGKCRFLEAMALKELGRYDEAASRLQALLSSQEFRSETALRGLSMLNLGNIRSLEGNPEQALVAYRAAQQMLEAGQNQEMVANLKGMVAESLGEMGQLGPAVDAYRETIGDYTQLGMQTRVAYFRVALSETLLKAGRPREAEWELLAALPTINEQQMVPEGFAAAVLLQESARQRQTNPKALTELRQYLQTAN